jgi:hypothetical protein
MYRTSRGVAVNMKLTFKVEFEEKRIYEDVVLIFEGADGSTVTEMLDRYKSFLQVLGYHVDGELTILEEYKFDDETDTAS